MSANHKPVQRTHFADDATLAYIAQLERDRARLVAALKYARDHGKMTASATTAAHCVLRDLGES